MNISLLFFILQIASLLTVSRSQCQPNLRIPRLYQQTFGFTDMHKFQVDSNYPYDSNYKIRYHFPVELLEITNSSNINYLLAISSIEWKFNPNFIKYRLRVAQKSEISLLIQFDSLEIQWTDFKFSVLLNDQSFREGIYFGSTTFYRQQNYLTDPNPNANILKKVTVDLPSQLIYAKTTAFITGVDVKPKGSDLLYEFRLTSKLIGKNIELAVEIGQKTQVVSIQTSFVAWTLETSHTKNLYMISDQISFTEMEATKHGKMREFLPANNLYMMGINQYKAKQGFGQFNISVASKKQSVIEVTSGTFIERVSISYFGVSNSPQEICYECSKEKLAYFNNKQTKCVSKCQSPFYIYDYSNGDSACAYCSKELQQQLTHDGKCQCQLGNKCNTNVSFSTKDNECLEENQEYKQGKCVCRAGYEQQNGECKYRCDNGYWDGTKCEKCEPNTYPWPQLSQCRLCQPDCQKCQNAFQCQKCNLGFRLDQLLGVCNEVCGDGVNYYHECDDRNQENGDGCSQQCKIETGYICQRNSALVRDICQQIKLQVSLTEAIAISMGYQIILQMKPGPNKKLPREELQEIFKIEIKETQKGQRLDPYQIYISQIQQQVNGKEYYGKIRILFNYAGSFPTQAVPVEITINFGSSAKIGVDLDFGNPFLSLQNSLKRLN